jgi:taurine dioxygenase
MWSVWAVSTTALISDGDRWHTDRANDEYPAKGFVLYCEEAPDYGGDTLFASLCQPYDTLPPDADRDP